MVLYHNKVCYFGLWFRPTFFLGWRWRGWHKVKLTRTELFSERNNYARVIRFCGISYIRERKDHA